jgi:hypothetical protein
LHWPKVQLAEELPDGFVRFVIVLSGELSVAAAFDRIQFIHHAGFVESLVQSGDVKLLV